MNTNYTPRTDAFYGCPPPGSGKDWQNRGTKAERDFARELERELAEAKKLAEDRLAWGNEVHRQFVQETGYTSNLRAELLSMAGNAEKERLDKEEARADLAALRESYKTITKWYDEAVQQLAGARGVIARLKVAARALLDRLAWYRSDEGAESKDDFEPLKLAQDALALTPETYQDEFLKVVSQRDRHIALFNDEQEKTASLRAEKAALRELLQQIIATVKAHEIESLQCDGKEEEHCNCLAQLITKADVHLAKQ